MKIFPSLLCALALLVMPAVTSTAAALNGIQSEDTLTIGRGLPSKLTDFYTVPQGKKLVLEPGAQIVAEKDARLIIKGELVIKGDEKNPVLMRGRKWKGITIDAEGKAAVNGLHITGADNALEVQGAAPLIQNSAFVKNENGILIEGKGATEINNVLFSENTGNGCFLTEKKVIVRNCTFIKNKGSGVYATGTNPTFERCYFENNKAGILVQNAGGSSGINGSECHFAEKGIGIESGISHGAIRFPKCYWGVKSTNQLKSKGVNTNLSNIKDAHDNSGSLKIVLTDFLTTPPKPCGATVKSKL